MSDKDSLFGSPPPSPPTRGRSPSLALPESPACSAWGLDTYSQNVGTIALPGSHEQCSELPVFIDPALPSGKLPVLSLRPPAVKAPARAPPARQPASRPATRSPPPPRQAHNPQTDRTLRDLVGLISHFEPVAHATAPGFRPPPIALPSASTSSHSPGTAQNPIVIDEPKPADAVQSALIALAGTVASALRLPTAPADTPLTQPTVNNVLHYIKHDPSLIPVLQATYEYLGSIPKHPQSPPRSFSHVHTNHPASSLPRGTRRGKDKGLQIPAGAGHWNVPFPFAPGEAPNDYSSQWQLQRGRRVLGDLLGLFERAFVKVRGDGRGSALPSSGRPKKRQRTLGPESVMESARSDYDESMDVRNKGKATSKGAEGDQPDQQRMTDWLSSVPPLAVSSSIVESTSQMPSPSPSDAAPSSFNDLQDIMAMFGTNCFGANTTVSDNGTNQDPACDFEGVLGDLDFGKDDVDTSSWDSMFGSGPPSQSINDITAFPMNIIEDSIPSHSLALDQPPREFAIDPVLIALSQQQVTGPPPSPPSHGSSSEQMFSTDVSCSKTELDGLTPLMKSYNQPSAARLFHGGEAPEGSQPQLSTPERDLGESQPLDALSLLTVPTTSASSSRHGSIAPTVSPAPSVIALGPSLPTRAQRKAAVLAKAKAHREKLVNEIERAKLERWKTVIESGVLGNIKRVGAE